MAAPQLAGLERWAARYARVAVGAAFLSAVAGRFGLWGGHLNWENFARFINRTAELNPFVPAPAIPFVAWAATIVETSIGVALIAGVYTCGGRHSAARCCWHGLERRWPQRRASNLRSITRSSPDRRRPYCSRCTRAARVAERRRRDRSDRFLARTAVHVTRGIHQCGFARSHSLSCPV